MNKEVESRRPIASRDSSWAKQFASALAKANITPNFISIVSILFSMFSFLMFYFDYKAICNHTLCMILAILGIQGRLLMNLLDGMVAIEHNKKSLVGGLFNEVPDRISDGFSILGVGLVAKQFPYAMDLAYMAIILAVTTAYIRTLGASLSCGHHFLGPMAKQHRMALICAGCLIGIWYAPIFYYLLIVMNLGLVITCYRRLSKIYTSLQLSSHDSKS